ncbi:MAG: aspartyl protease family protein [Gemmataceae bacterium]|nr:aspartyl protease family protein [Gemmataceae bacterium]
MIRYRYVTHLNPPAPFINVSAKCPGTGRSVANLPAQIDTAADKTVLPDRLVQELGLVEDGRMMFQGFAGEVVELPVFLIQLQVHALAPINIRAVIGKHEPHVLLGRDVLNSYRLLLDGPQLALEIG